MKPTVPHAIQRAMERYGLKLSYDDLLDLCAECLKGYGRLSYMPDGKERHLLSCHGKPVVVIYAPFDGVTVHQQMGRIITLLPKEAATNASSKSVTQKYRNTRLVPRKKMPKSSWKNRRWT